MSHLDRPKVGFILSGYLDAGRTFLESQRTIQIGQTPFGAASNDHLIVGKQSGLNIALLSRRNNMAIPSCQVNHKANIVALKKYGCDIVLGLIPCCSLDDRIQIGNQMVVTDYFDR